MLRNFDALVDEYSGWLQDRPDFQEIEDHLEITAPYLDRHNDYLQIYVKRINGEFVLTDDGYVLDDLEMSGRKIDRSNRQTLLKLTANGFGVQTNNNALEVKASPANFSLKKHNLIQAMLAVDDLYCFTSSSVECLFSEDVINWLDGFHARYTPNFSFTGMSGYDHHFDFVIPKSKFYPERVIRVINRLTLETAQSMAFSRIDIKKVRSPAARVYAIVNDSEQSNAEDLLNAMHSFGVSVVSWSAREAAKTELAA